MNRRLIDALNAASGADISTVLDWVTTQDPALIAAHFGTREKTLLRLDNVLGIARLEAFIAKADELLRSNAEGQWQDFLRHESWAIAQLYAEPVVILNNQPYVGGKGVDNRGGSVADFLFANELSDNCLLVEIKTPMTPLVVEDKAARNRSFNVSPALSGATIQLLNGCYTLEQDYRSLMGDRRRSFLIFSPRLLLIIGTIASLDLPDDEDKSIEMKRSFELYRGNLRNVEVVAFDELVRKARALLALLRSTSNSAT